MAHRKKFTSYPMSTSQKYKTFITPLSLLVFVPAIVISLYLPITAYYSIQVKTLPFVYERCVSLLRHNSDILPFLAQLISQFYANEIIGTFIIGCICLVCAHFAEKTLPPLGGMTMLIKWLIIGSILGQFVIFFQEASLISLDVIFVMVMLVVLDKAVNIKSPPLFILTNFIVSIFTTFLTFLGAASVSFTVLFKSLQSKKYLYSFSIIAMILGSYYIFSIAYMPILKTEWLQLWNKAKSHYIGIVPYCIIPIIWAIYIVGKNLKVSVEIKSFSHASKSVLFIEIILSGVCTCLLYFLTHQSARITGIIHTLAYQQKWDQILSRAKSLHYLPGPIWIETIHALVNKGRLLDDLFQFPVIKERELIPHYEEGVNIVRARGMLLLELGHINLAEHMLHESLELEGPAPPTLLALAKIHILKNRPLAALPYLNHLKAIPFWKTTANRWISYVNGILDPQIQDELNNILPYLVKVDIASSRFDTIQLMETLLESNPENEKALAILIAQHLVSRDLKRFKNVLLNSNFSTKIILPRIVEEAAVLLLALGESLPPHITSKIQSATFQRFESFVKLHQNNSDFQQSFNMLALEFGDSYWFFYIFGKTSQARK